MRQAGQEVVLVLYKVDQEAVRAEMPEDNYRTRSVLSLTEQEHLGLIISIY